MMYFLTEILQIQEAPWRQSVLRLSLKSLFNKMTCSNINCDQKTGGNEKNSNNDRDTHPLTGRGYHQTSRCQCQSISGIAINCYMQTFPVRGQGAPFCRAFHYSEPWGLSVQGKYYPSHRSVLCN